MKSKYNNVKNLLKDTNNYLQVHYLKLVNHKQALLNRDTNLHVVKTQLSKQQAKNKHLVAKGVEAERVIKKAETLQF